jgi:CRISPR/Cas system CMR-associated protein Cmr5 small subunit
MVKSQEQKRMQSAWEALTRRFGSDTPKWRDNTHAEDYLRAAQKTPARIHRCGLGQALAFLKSRGERDVSQQVADDISRITLENLHRQDGADLIAILCASDISWMFAATEEAQSVTGWLIDYLRGAAVGEDAASPSKVQEGGHP